MDQIKISEDRRPPVSTLLLSVLVGVLALALCILAVVRLVPRTGAAEEADDLAAYRDSGPQAEPPASLVTPDGVPGSVLCRESYTVCADEAGAAAGKTVASMGGKKLTNEALQAYYLNAIRTYQAGGSEAQPDVSLPLDEQLCPLEDGITWQHYFLRQAVRDWQTLQVLRGAAQEPRPITEEDYKPNETDDLHGKYVAEDLPVNDFLYQDLPCYTPNKMHQAYLDGLEAQMEAMAEELGYDSLEACADAAFGGQVSAQILVQAAQDYNFGYMYLTEESYDISVSREEIDAYREEHRSELPKDGCTVDIRHVLLIPEGAKAARNGTVTAKKARWELCGAEAEKMLDAWKRNFLTTWDAEANFARMANENSMDAGSSLDGGSYRGIRPGQLIKKLDEWCFDPQRQVGDTAVIRTSLGYHILFLSAKNDDADTAARQALTKARLLEQVEQRRGKKTCKVNYNAAALWADPAADAVLPVDMLYPDIAHERFPEAIVYFQQDYMFSPYGSSYVGRGGCGITTMAMLATYMTDTILTPHMLSQRYGKYHDENGTMGELFRYTPAEMGFYLDRISANIDDMIEALENGQRVVSLQHKGRFTSGGHYLLLQQYYEEDDTFQVRDSNIYNYARLEGHKIDKFTRSDLLSGSATAYIMQKKITRIPACARCGDTFEQTAPERLFNEDYLCHKCTAALARRDAFLELMGA